MEHVANLTRRVRICGAYCYHKDLPDGPSAECECINSGLQPSCMRFLKMLEYETVDPRDPRRLYPGKVDRIKGDAWGNQMIGAIKRCDACIDEFGVGKDFNQMMADGDSGFQKETTRGG